MLLYEKNLDMIYLIQITIPESLAGTAGLLAETASLLTGHGSRELTFGRGSVNGACAVSYANGENGRMVSG